jgi:hypothetical protein
MANGQVIQCQSELHYASWEIQGVKFISDFNLLPFLYYDVILGLIGYRSTFLCKLIGLTSGW